MTARRGRAALAISLLASVLGACAAARPSIRPDDVEILRTTLANPAWIAAVSDRIRETRVGTDAFAAFAREARAAVGPGAVGDWLADVEAGRRDTSPEVADLWAVLVRRYALIRYRDAALAALQDLVRRPTIRPAGTSSAASIPAFEDLSGLLEKLAERESLGYRNYDFNVLSVRTGVGPDPVTILTHADVVPADAARWRHPPFEAVVADGAVWGRGTLDDKSPIAVHVYAMRALLDAGLPLARDVELLVGTAEETTWEGIRAYLAHNPAPRICYVADAEFPVIIGEKGALNFTVEGTRRPPEAIGAPSGFFLERFDAGTAPNVVPADARATVAIRGLSAGGDPGEILRAALERFRATGAEVEIGYVLAGDRVHLRARGKAAHGARPWDGWNAATYLLGFLHDQLEMGAADLGDLAGWLVERVGLELDGASLGISLDDEEMGETSVNLGLVAIGAPGEPESATLNIRWPVGRTVARTIDLLAARVAEYGRAKGGRLDTRTAYAFDPILVDAGSPIVRSLLTTWRAVTGEDAGPRLIAGTTYAKAIAGAVSFGPNFEGSGLKIHGDDEHLPLDHLDRLIELYTDALVRLTYPSAALGRSPSGADE